MVRSLNKLRHAVLEAMDGEIGRCRDFLFDDERWTVRYMVAGTGKWLPGRQVLVSPRWTASIDWEKKQLNLDMSRKQVKDSPELDPDRPITRDFEIALFHHYGVPPYWRD